jgi:hypothetical protein
MFGRYASSFNSSIGTILELMMVSDCDFSIAECANSDNCIAAKSMVSNDDCIFERTNISELIHFKRLA